MKIFIIVTSLILSLYASSKIGVDCIILEDEDSIVCKYTHKRVSYDKIVTVRWIDPHGFLSRIRDMKIPAYHGSIYDYRYIKGRIKGVWKFEVVDANQSFSTTFELK